MKIKFSNQVRFVPWVGKTYKEGFHGVKTLIMGESHYRKGGKSFSRTLNIELIKGQADGIGKYTKPYAFWTKIVKTLSPDAPDKNRFWHSVSYYNYIQEFVGSDPRDRPTQQMWDNAVEPFFEVVKKLRPNFILILGHTLDSKLSTELSQHSIHAHRTVINHPSSFGFKYAKWRSKVAKGLKKAASLRRK